MTRRLEAPPLRTPSPRLVPFVLVLGLLLPAAALALPAVTGLSFTHYVSPFAGRAGETAIGVNPATNNVFFQRLLHTDRIHFDDTTVPATPTWTDVSPDLNNDATSDPMLYTDRASGRTFVIHLRIEYSMSTVTDTTLGDGATWLPTQPPTTYPYFDHQSVGAGPHAILPNALPAALNAMYYCGQAGTAVCARSDDDGLTWGPYVPINTGTGCGGLHGHPRVGLDGTALVPNKSCSGAQGVHISNDNGLSWHTVTIPGSQSARSDPNIAVGDDGRLWVAMASGGKPKVSWSDDAGEHWVSALDLSAVGGITSGNVEFPMMVAGDAGRAAMAWYGTPTAGNDQSSTFTGAWHLYVAATIDGGATWSVVDTTPNDPIQRGCIWLQGGTNACRNLLDFQGATVDAEGRIVVGWADGCISAACIASTGTPDDSRDSKGVITRQDGGPRMYAAFDP